MKCSQLPFKCTLCGKNFSKFEPFRIHSRRHKVYYDPTWQRTCRRNLHNATRLKTSKIKKWRKKVGKVDQRSLNGNSASATVESSDQCRLSHNSNVAHNVLPETNINFVSSIDSQQLSSDLSPVYTIEDDELPSFEIRRSKKWRKQGGKVNQRLLNSNNASSSHNNNVEFVSGIDSHQPGLDLSPIYTIEDDEPPLLDLEHPCAQESSNIGTGRHSPPLLHKQDISIIKVINKKKKSVNNNTFTPLTNAALGTTMTSRVVCNSNDNVNKTHGVDDFTDVDVVHENTSATFTRDKNVRYFARLSKKKSKQKTGKMHGSNHRISTARDKSCQIEQAVKIANNREVNDSTRSLSNTIHENCTNTIVVYENTTATLTPDQNDSNIDCHQSKKKSQQKTTKIHGSDHKRSTAPNKRCQTIKHAVKRLTHKMNISTRPLSNKSHPRNDKLPPTSETRQSTIATAKLDQSQKLDALQKQIKKPVDAQNASKSPGEKRKRILLKKSAKAAAKPDRSQKLDSLQKQSKKPADAQSVSKAPGDKRKKRLSKMEKIKGSQPVKRRRKKGETDIIGSFPCKVCNKIFSRRRYVQIHMICHSDVKNYVCKYCSKRFARKHHLYNHELTHTQERPAECHICQKRFTQQSYLKQHILVHTGEKPFKCDKCDRWFKQKSHLGRHMLQAHSTLRPHECTQCGKAFKVIEGLRVHERSHRTDRPYKCGICSADFGNKSYLRLHQRSHSNDRRYICKICGDSFVQNNHLKSHMFVHSDDRPQVCKICDKRFKLKSSLVAHLRSHSDERKYKCPICPRTYKNSNGLKAHHRWHLGIKPYECQYCGRRFSYSNHCKTHERLHTGEKIFSCSICNERFHRKVQLMRHSNAVHTYDKCKELTVAGKNMKTGREIEFDDLSFQKFSENRIINEEGTQDVKPSAELVLNDALSSQPIEAESHEGQQQGSEGSFSENKQSQITQPIEAGIHEGQQQGSERSFSENKQSQITQEIFQPTDVNKSRPNDDKPSETTPTVHALNKKQEKSKKCTKRTLASKINRSDQKKKKKNRKRTDKVTTENLLVVLPVDKVSELGHNNLSGETNKNTKSTNLANSAEMNADETSNDTPVSHTLTDKGKRGRPKKGTKSNNGTENLLVALPVDEVSERGHKNLSGETNKNTKSTNPANSAGMDADETSNDTPVLHTLTEKGKRGRPKKGTKSNNGTENLLVALPVDKVSERGHKNLSGETNKNTKSTNLANSAEMNDDETSNDTPVLHTLTEKGKRGRPKKGTKSNNGTLGSSLVSQTTLPKSGYRKTKMGNKSTKPIESAISDGEGTSENTQLLDKTVERKRGRPKKSFKVRVVEDKDGQSTNMKTSESHKRIQEISTEGTSDNMQLLDKTVKRKRGRPKKCFKVRVAEDKDGQSTNIKTSDLHKRIQEISTEGTSDNTQLLNKIVKRKRGRPKKCFEVRVAEDKDGQTTNIKTPESHKPIKEISTEGTSGNTQLLDKTVKRKRGRPKKCFEVRVAEGKDGQSTNIKTSELHKPIQEISTEGTSDNTQLLDKAVKRKRGRPKNFFEVRVVEDKDGQSTNIKISESHKRIQEISTEGTSDNTQLLDKTVKRKRGRPKKCFEVRVAEDKNGQSMNIETSELHKPIQEISTEGTSDNTQLLDKTVQRKRGRPKKCFKVRVAEDKDGQSTNMKTSESHKRFQEVSTDYSLAPQAQCKQLSIVLHSVDKKRTLELQKCPESEDINNNDNITNSMETAKPTDESSSLDISPVKCKQLSVVLQPMNKGAHLFAKHTERIDKYTADRNKVETGKLAKDEALNNSLEPNILYNIGERVKQSNRRASIDKEKLATTSDKLDKSTFQCKPFSVVLHSIEQESARDLP